MSGESMSDQSDGAFEAEWTRAKRVLELARFRMANYRAAFGDGRVDRDLARRLRDALARVRHLETLAA